MWVCGFLVIAAAIALATPLAAKEPEKAVAADTAEKFAPLATTIRHEMEPGGRYEFIGSRDKRAVDDELDQMAALLAKSGSVAAMGDKDRLALFNAQEKVNGVLARNASDRLICTNEAPVGSHLPVKTCRTYGDIARNRADSNRQFGELNDAARARDAANRTGR